MRILFISALAASTVLGAAPAAAADKPASIGDWRRAVACVALTEKMALENERGLASFSAAARRDPNLASKLKEIQQQEAGNIAVKRKVAATLRARADTMLTANHAAWSSAQSLPPATVLAEQEQKAATRAAAKPRNIAALTAALDAQRCEEFLVG